LAVQLWVGLLPKRRFRAGVAHCARRGFTRPTVGSNAKGASPLQGGTLCSGWDALRALAYEFALGREPAPLVFALQTQSALLGALGSQVLPIKPLAVDVTPRNGLSRAEIRFTAQTPYRLLRTHLGRKRLGARFQVPHFKSVHCFVIHGLWRKQ